MKNRGLLIAACSFMICLFIASPGFAAGTDTCKSYVEGTIDDSGPTGILGGNNTISLEEELEDSVPGYRSSSDDVMLDSSDNLVSMSCWYHAWDNDHDPFIGNLSGATYWSEQWLENEMFRNSSSFERYSTIVSFCHEDGSVTHATASGVWLDSSDRQKANLTSGVGFGNRINNNYCNQTAAGGTMYECALENETKINGKILRGCSQVVGEILANSGHFKIKTPEKLSAKNGTGGGDPCAEFFNNGGLEGKDGDHYQDTLAATNHVVCSAFDPSKINSGKDMVYAISETSIGIESYDIVITVAVSSLTGEEPNDAEGIKLIEDPSGADSNGAGRSYISEASWGKTYQDYPLTKSENTPDRSLTADGGLTYRKVKVRMKNVDNGDAIHKAVGENPNGIENYVVLTICPADWEKGDSYEKCLHIDTNGIKNAFVMPEITELAMYSSDDPEPKCTDGGGGWSWFACAATKEISEQVKNIYGIVAGYLSFDPSIFNTETGLHDAWNTARLISNGVLVVLLLIVILSQISGIGIDNYGIKKMLPRIIVVVILINLSFILFRAAVDLANIFGNAITNVFDSIAQNVNTVMPAGGNAIAGNSGAIFAGGATLAMIAAFFSVIAFLKSGESIIVLALAAIIIVAIAILMMYTIIVLRQALLIILSVTAPIMLLFYLVPAGNPTFKKWMNLVKGLLLAYPLCSLVVSGGNFAAKVIISVMGGNVAPSSSAAFSGLGFNPFVYVIAISANIAPIFFLPKMIIQSTGKLGAMVKGAADKLGRSLSGGMKGMDFAKQLKHGAEARANRMNAGVNRKGEKAWWGGVTKSRNATRRMAAEEAASKDRAERRDAQFMADNPEAAMFEQNVKEEMQALEDEGIDLSSEAAITQALNDRVSDVESAQGRATIEAIARSAASSRTLGNKKAPVDAAIMKFLNNSGASQDAKAAVARARIKRSGNGMLAKSPSDYMKYQDYIAGRNVNLGDQAYEDGVMQRVIHSEHFSGGALAGYAGPEVERLADFYSRASAADQDIIRTAYDNRGDKRANDSDTDTFEPLRRVIGH